MNIKTFEQHSTELGAVDSNDTFVIETLRNTRYFFITEIDNSIELTWRKENAKQFNTIEETENFIKTNKLDIDLLTKSFRFKNYEIKKYSDVRSH